MWGGGLNWQPFVAFHMVQNTMWGIAVQRAPDLELPLQQVQYKPESWNMTVLLAQTKERRNTSLEAYRSQGFNKALTEE